MMSDRVPDGHIELYGGTLVRIEFAKHYTKDFERFMRYLPLVRREDDGTDWRKQVMEFVGPDATVQDMVDATATSSEMRVMLEESSREGRALLADIEYHYGGAEKVPMDKKFIEVLAELRNRPIGNKS